MGSLLRRLSIKPTDPGRLRITHDRRAPRRTRKLRAARDEWKPESVARRAGGGAAAGRGRGIVSHVPPLRGGRVEGTLGVIGPS